MKRALLLFPVFIGFCSCSKIDRDCIIWNGDKEIPNCGGTVVWMPVNENVRLTPQIIAVSLSYYNSEGGCINTVKFQDTQGDCYYIKTDINTVSIHLSANDFDYNRELQVGFEDGVTKGGHAISIIQGTRDF